MLLTIAIGYSLKRSGLLTKQDARVLSKVMINVTLPCVIIRNLNGTVIVPELLAAIAAGFLVNFFLVLAALWAARGRGAEERYVYLFSIPLFNISGYAVPVAQMFASEQEIAALLLFNLPTTVFTYVIVPAIAGTSARGNARAGLKQMGGSILKNIPAMVSLLMTVLCLLRVTIPRGAVELLSNLSAANTALAMLSIGLIFELPGGRFAKSMKAVLLRLICVSAAALCVWFAMPMGDLKSVVFLALFAPLVSTGPALALEQGYTGDAVALVNSSYLPVSVVCMAVLSGLLF